LERRPDRELDGANQSPGGGSGLFPDHQGLEVPQAASDPLAVDHLRGDLKGRAVRGGTITLASQIFRSFLQLGATAVLARLLTKDDFGLVAIVLAIAGLVAIFKDAGLSTATIQREHVTTEQISALFWLNLVLSVSAAGLLCAVSPVIAGVYGDPRLIGATLVISSTFVLAGVSVQHRALAARRMAFRQIETIEVSAVVAGVVSGISIAWFGFGYWALVAQVVVTSACQAAGWWLCTDWRPGRPKRVEGTGELIRFGAGLTGASGFNQIREQLPALIYGGLFGSALLAVYDRSYRLLVFPVRRITPALASVAVPTLSRLAGEPDQFRKYARGVLTLAISASAPVSLLALLAAPEVIRVMLGAQWSEAALIFAYLSPLAMTQAASSVMLWAMTSSGRSGAVFRFSVWNAILAGLSVAVGVLFGFEDAVLVFSLVGVLVRTPILVMFCVRSTALTLSDLARSIGWLTAVGFVIGIVGLFVRREVVGLGEVSFIWAAGAAVAVPGMWLLVLVLTGSHRVILLAARSLRKA